MFQFFPGWELDLCDYLYIPLGRSLDQVNAVMSDKLHQS